MCVAWDVHVLKRNINYVYISIHYRLTSYTGIHVKYSVQALKKENKSRSWGKLLFVDVEPVETNGWVHKSTHFHLQN